ncbi:MAG TPA: hypothetical protein VED59_08715, partial [Acidimicrobiales bacterium]|nr:hypothetical protein [Acidimicrobiales bacterium]
MDMARAALGDTSIAELLNLQMGSPLLKVRALAAADTMVAEQYALNLPVSPADRNVLILAVANAVAHQEPARALRLLDLVAIPRDPEFVADYVETALIIAGPQSIPLLDATLAGSSVIFPTADDKGAL